LLSNLSKVRHLQLVLYRREKEYAPEGMDALKKNADCFKTGNLHVDIPQTTHNYINNTIYTRINISVMSVIACIEEFIVD
jgi:hypothetical protein